MQRSVRSRVVRGRAFKHKGMQCSLDARRQAFAANNYYHSVQSAIVAWAAGCNSVAGPVSAPAVFESVGMRVLLRGSHALPWRWPPEPSTVQAFARAASARVPVGLGPRIVVVQRRTSRALTNAANLAASLPGAVVVDFSDMPFREQVRLMQSAEVLIGAHGAGLTNLLWMPVGGRVVELEPPSFRSPCYEQLAALAGHRYARVQCAYASGHKPPVTLEAYVASQPADVSLRKALRDCGALVVDVQAVVATCMAP